MKRLRGSSTWRRLGSSLEERRLRAVSNELWCVLDPAGNSQSSCNNENNKLGRRTQDRIIIWTSVICILKERVMQKLIVIGLLISVPFLLLSSILPPQLGDLRQYLSFLFIYLNPPEIHLLINLRERKRWQRNRLVERNITWLPPICTFPRDQTDNLLVYGMTRQPTELPGQGSSTSFLTIS